MWREDGLIGFHGRRDRQVKVRGYRIELDSIETVLSEFPGCEEVSVVYRNTEAGGVLTAYVSRARGVKIEDLRQFARDRLPHYMLPDIFIVLPRIPLNNNGKRDLQLLSRPDAYREVRNESHAPANALESALLMYAGEVLQCADLKATDNFFDCGGNSLKAMALANAARLQLHVGVGVMDIYECPTVGLLAAKILRHGWGNEMVKEAKV
jgi:hypothetical protein